MIRSQLPVLAAHPTATPQPVPKRNRVVERDEVKGKSEYYQCHLDLCEHLHNQQLSPHRLDR